MPLCPVWTRSLVKHIVRQNAWKCQRHSWRTLCSNVRTRNAQNIYIYITWMSHRSCVCNHISYPRGQISFNSFSIEPFHYCVFFLFRFLQWWKSSIQTHIHTLTIEQKTIIDSLAQNCLWFSPCLFLTNTTQPLTMPCDRNFLCNLYVKWKRRTVAERMSKMHGLISACNLSFYKRKIDTRIKKMLETHNYKLSACYRPLKILFWALCRQCSMRSVLRFTIERINDSTTTSNCSRITRLVHSSNIASGANTIRRCFFYYSNSYIMASRQSLFVFFFILYLLCPKKGEPFP